MDFSENDAGDTWRVCDGEGPHKVISSLMGGSSTENIWMAAGDGDTERVLEILSDSPHMIDAQDENGYSPLSVIVVFVSFTQSIDTCMHRIRHAASSYGNVEVVEVLLAAGAIVDIKDSDGDTPLHFCERPDIAELILLAGADKFAVNNEGNTVLDKCIEDDNHEMASYWVIF